MGYRLTATALALVMMAGQAWAQPPAAAPAKPPKWNVNAPPGMTTHEIRINVDN
ncbi:MAG: hypothetical protein JSS35_10665, partial [Proteobacteria bacterium]|nr:hypothetical protein [Pseudomonadota bacterium]